MDLEMFIFTRSCWVSHGVQIRWNFYFRQNWDFDLLSHTCPGSQSNLFYNSHHQIKTPFPLRGIWKQVKLHQSFICEGEISLILKLLLLSQPFIKYISVILSQMSDVRNHWLSYICHNVIDICHNVIDICPNVIDICHNVIDICHNVICIRMVLRPCQLCVFSSSTRGSSQSSGPANAVHVLVSRRDQTSQAVGEFFQQLVKGGKKVPFTLLEGDSTRQPNTYGTTL